MRLQQRIVDEDIDTERPADGTLARRFAEAFGSDDIDGVIDLLGDSAWPAMPPAPHAYQGPAAIAAFLEASARWRDGRRFRLVPTRANGQPAFGYYLPIQRGRGAEPIGIVVLSVRGHRIAAVTRLLDPELPRAFGVATPAD